MNDKFTDNTIMPFGKHKGEKLANIPADYFVWMYDNNIAKGRLKDYIEENWDAITKEYLEQKNHE